MSERQSSESLIADNKVNIHEFAEVSPKAELGRGVSVGSFSRDKIFINLKSDSETTEIIIEDDGDGYPKDILPKIGEPYLKTSN